MKTCMFLCFHVNFKHESTKTCMFHVFSSFSAYFHLPLYHNGKGSIVGYYMYIVGRVTIVMMRMVMLMTRATHF